MRPVRLLLVAALIVVGSGAPALARNKLDSATSHVVSAGAQSTVHVIVRTTPPGLQAVTAIVATMMANAGVSGTPLVHSILCAVTAEVGLADLATLAANPAVLSISSDAPVRASQVSSVDVAYLQLQQQQQAILAATVAQTATVNQNYAAQISAVTTAAAAADAMYNQTATSLQATLATQQQTLVILNAAVQAHKLDAGDPSVHQAQNGVQTTQESITANQHAQGDADHAASQAT
jgi:hypothetical protein